MTLISYIWNIPLCQIMWQSLTTHQCHTFRSQITILRSSKKINSLKETQILRTVFEGDATWRRCLNPTDWQWSMYVCSLTMFLQFYTHVLIKAKIIHCCPWNFQATASKDDTSVWNCVNWRLKTSWRRILRTNHAWTVECQQPSVNRQINGIAASAIKAARKQNFESI